MSHAMSGGFGLSGPYAPDPLPEPSRERKHALGAVQLSRPAVGEIERPGQIPPHEGTLQRLLVPSLEQHHTRGCQLSAAGTLR